MEKLSFRHTTRTALPGTRASAITGVVASGNLEVLLERNLAPDACHVEIDTAIKGYAEVWAAAGTPHALVRLPATELVRLTGGRVVRVT